MARRTQIPEGQTTDARRNRLITECLPEALSIARRYAADNYTLREDLEDEVLGALVDAALRFDPSRGPFWSYARPIVVGRIAMVFRDVKSREVCMGLLGAVEEVDMSAGSVERLAAAGTKEQMRCVLAAFGLDAPAVMDALFRRCSQRQAARAMGMRYHKFWRRLKRAKIVMRDFLAN